MKGKSGAGGICRLIRKVPDIIGIYFSIDVMRRFLSGRLFVRFACGIPIPASLRMRLGDFSEIK